MSAEEVGESIVELFGPVARYRIFKQFLKNGITIAEVSRKTGVPESSIRNALTKRRIPERVGRNLFTGLAKIWPSLLRKSIDLFMVEISKEIPWFKDALLELEGIKVKEVG
ncbi:MAG: hypothetical protein ACP6IP_10490 [Candidatus Njordarchaeia archaeon]